jgi:hypothetical protein
MRFPGFSSVRQESTGMMIVELIHDRFLPNHFKIIHPSYRSMLHIPDAASVVN